MAHGAIIVNELKLRIKEIAGGLTQENKIQNSNNPDTEMIGINALFKKLVINLK